jgi:hypothetical protein
LEIAVALDVSAVCEALGADGGASGGCSTNDDPSGAALSPFSAFDTLLALAKM